MHINRHHYSFYTEALDDRVGCGSEQLIPLWRLESRPLVDFRLHKWVAWEPALSSIADSWLSHRER